MIIKFNLLRLSIFSLLVILFPLVQNQWRNLYLFDKSNLSIYTLLYYSSGLIFPIIIFITSLNNFTVYKFSNNKTKRHKNINGKSLLIISFLSLVTLSSLIYSYILINYKIIHKLIDVNNKYLIDIEFDKYIYVVVFIIILLIFRKIKFIIKKILLINFLSISFIIWYLKVNNILFSDTYLTKFFIFENIDISNISFLLSIELVFYLWSYISNSSYLSDWNVPVPYKGELLPIFNILFFYLMVILYYLLIS